MFGFRSQRSKEEEKAGIQFLASMLVCYPEISSLSYDPRRSTLTFEFIVRGDYPARELDAFARLLSESIETYHVLVADEEVGANIWVEEVSAEKKTVMFHVERDVMTLERDELTQYKLAQDFIDMVHVMENPSLTEFFYERDGENWKKRII